jgi:hypothetical protein
MLKRKEKNKLKKIFRETRILLRRLEEDHGHSLEEKHELEGVLHIKQIYTHII